MHLTNFHFYNNKNYLYSKPVKDLQGCGLGHGFSFNGKELDKGDEGMGGGGSTYDYGFRIYNAQLGRFLSVDPLTSSYPFYSPYQYAGNNPIQNVDLDGLEELDSKYVFKGNTAKPQILSQSSKDVLNKIIKQLGVDKLTITSTGRTPEEQANIMYTNLVNGSSSSYGKGGRAVIKVYNELKATASPDEIKAAMLAKIIEVGPAKVSSHCKDPDKINAIDFGINTLNNDIGSEKVGEMKNLLNEMVESGEIKVFLNPDNNKGEAAFHIEVVNKDSEKPDLFKLPVIQQDNTSVEPPVTPVNLKPKS